jgi:hypothetical protein
MLHPIAIGFDIRLNHGRTMTQSYTDDISVIRCDTVPPCLKIKSGH